VVVLTAVASQAAMALGTIERASRLATEQERNRIARDIHDTMTQSLFGIVLPSTPVSNAAPPCRTGEAGIGGSA